MGEAWARLCMRLHARAATTSLRRASTDERGAMLSEYGLLISFAVFAIVAAVALFGDALVGLFTDATTDFDELEADR